MPHPFFTDWFQPLGDLPEKGTVRAYGERPGSREEVLRAAARLLVEHYVGIETILKAGGFEKAADTIRNSLPTKKRIQSGDVGEIFAVEYLHAETGYRVPIPKLRYKSDRDTALHGNDLIAVNKTGKKPRVLRAKVRAGQTSAGHTCRTQ